MLEQPTLLVRDWMHVTMPAGGPAWLRPITDTGGRSLGFVRLDGDAEASWLSWLRRVRLDVFETDDASHLLSLARAWGVLRVWDLHDAEERHVGSVYPTTFTDPESRRRGFIDKQSNGQGRILDPSGAVLALFFRQGPDALALSFSPAPLPNPFLRMLMLGSILTLEPTPKKK